MKSELVYHESYQRHQDTLHSIFEYIEVFYNRQRKHSTLEYLCPDEHEKQSEQEQVKIRKKNPGFDHDKTEFLLTEIIEQLKKMQRENMFSEFSIMRLLAGIIQILVLFCILATIWFLMGDESKNDSVFISLGFAVVLQLMALTFYIMQGRK